MFIKEATLEYPVTRYHLSQRHPNVSFPANLSDEALKHYGYAVVKPTPRPAGDVVTEGQPEQRDGVWYQTWNVRDYTPEEIADQQVQSLEEERQSMVVSRFQARAALLKAGLLDQVKTIMSGPETDPLTVLAWEEATEYQRWSPTIATIGAALNLSDEQLDYLFREAAKVSA